MTLPRQTRNGGGGYWGLRAEAKHWSNRARRTADRSEAEDQLDGDQSGES